MVAFHHPFSVARTLHFVTMFLVLVRAKAAQDPLLRGRKKSEVSGGPSIGSHQNRKLQTSTVVYPAELPYSSLVSNPERGFYWQDSYYASSTERLDASSLASIRSDTGMTVMLRLYYLDDFVYGDDISQSVLDDIEADFDALRTAGVKAVLRFAYVNNNDDPSAPTEPPKDKILSHIAQLAPILTANQDAIIAVQAGFIGPWGEWHSSTHFDDDSEGKGEIVAALLDALPDRIVQIRTPLQKQTLYETTVLPEPTTGYVLSGDFEGSNVASNWNAHMNGYSITSDEAHTGSHSIVVTNGGAQQQIYLKNSEGGPGSTIEISGYSKSVGTSVAMGGDYSIYADVKYTDGSYLYGQIATFAGGTSTNWEKAEYSFVVPQGKTASDISLYAMYRNDSAGGQAYFDDIQVKVYGPAISTGGGALDSTSAYDGSHIARTGHHNDCFLASDTDFGTYTNPNGDEYPYLSQDTMYTAMGGETCNENAPRSECTTALSELELFHYSYLNSGYNEDVLQSWSLGGCMEEVTAKLGYRLVLQTGTFPINLEPGGNLPYDILLQNVGYASPINPKRVQLVLRESASGTICAATDTSTDVRTWYGGGRSHTLQGVAVLPQDIAPGTYDLYLNIADSTDALKTRLEFKVGVANSGDLNEVDTGLIDLQHSIQVVTSGGYSFPPQQSGFMHDMLCGVESEIVPPTPPATDPDSYVTNGSFEGSPSLDWTPYMDGYEEITGDTHSGAKSIAVTNGGAKQSVYVDAPKGSTITLSGFSKASGVTPNLGSDYSIYADVKYVDGSYLWGQRAEFSGTSTAWTYSDYSFEATKAVEKLNLYALYRNDPANGLALFDDIVVLVEQPLVMNGGFEGDVSADWSAFSNGYSVSTNEAYNGDQSVLVTNGAARQWVSLNAESGSSITLSGYSKAVGTSVNLWSDYSVYADVTYDDNTYLWGQVAMFTGGTSDWEFAEKTFVVPAGKTVIGMTIYTMYRNDSAGGSAYFDDIKVNVN